MNVEELKELMDNKKASVQKVQSAEKHSGLARANGNMGYKEFIKEISRMVKLAFPNVKFVHDDDAKRIIDKAKREEDITFSIISFKLVKRIPYLERKGRLREEVPRTVNNDDPKQRFGTIYGNRFMSYVRFKIYSSTTDGVEKLLEDFEDLVTQSYATIKSKGINDIFFEYQEEDTTQEVIEDFFSIRSIVYSVITERLQVIFNSKIEKITNNFDEE